MANLDHFEEEALDALMAEGSEEPEWGEGEEGEVTNLLDTLHPSEGRALRVTNLFETGGTRALGFDRVTGNFDGQGISFGVLQWNIGTGSLQPLLLTYRSRQPSRFAAIFGADAVAFGELLRTRKGETTRQAVARQLAWARTVADRRTVHAPWLERFRRLGREPAFQAIQLEAIRGRLAKAWKYMRQLGLSSERALVLMFDLVTQQGGAWLDARGTNRRARLSAAIAAKTRSLGRALTEREKLEQIARTVAATTGTRFRDRVLQRKMAIVDGTTRVRGLRAGLDATFGISDRVAGSSASAPATAARPPTPVRDRAPAPASGRPQVSALARVGPKLRKGSRRPAPIFGVVVHTTGSGPAVKAKKTGKPAIGFALRYYLDGKGGFPHYVIDYDGTIHATCDEREAAWHAGWSGIGGKAFFKAPWQAPAWWRTTWDRWKVRTPVELLAPGTSGPNAATIGIELLGALDRRYTDAQYAALARLIADIRSRNALHVPGAPSPTLLGHEDLLPVSRREAIARFGKEKGEGNHRADDRGGWDPGAHRSDPRFSWSRLWRLMNGGAGELDEAA